MINNAWDLRLPLPRGNESPHSRKARGITAEDHCVQRIVYLQYKDSIFLSVTTAKFKEEAAILYSNWIHKPKAERIVPRKTRSVPNPITDDERKELVAFLRKHLDAAYAEASLNTPSKLSFSERFNDAPIASPRLPRMKRTSDEGFEDISTAKKQKGQAQGKENEMPPPPRSRRQTQTRAETLNPDTSFYSTADSVFSHQPVIPAQTTQTTTPDDDVTRPNSPLPPQGSNYGSSSFDEQAHIKLDQSFELTDHFAFQKAKSRPETKDLCRRLGGTFRKYHESDYH